MAKNTKKQAEWAPPAAVPVYSGGVEIVHDSTLGPNLERYKVVGPNVSHSFSVRSDAELAEIASKMAVKSVKKKENPRSERYFRLENDKIVLK